MEVRKGEELMIPRSGYPVVDIGYNTVVMAGMTNEADIVRS